MKSIYTGDKSTLEDLYHISMGAVAILWIVFTIVMLINTDKCKNR